MGIDFGLRDELYSLFLALGMKNSVMGFHFIGVECNEIGYLSIVREESGDLSNESFLQLFICLIFYR